jgi:hypothetical protein
MKQEYKLFSLAVIGLYSLLVTTAIYLSGCAVCGPEERVKTKTLCFVDGTIVESYDLLDLGWEQLDCKRLTNTVSHRTKYNCRVTSYVATDDGWAPVSKTYGCFLNKTFHEVEVCRW